MTNMLDDIFRNYTEVPPCTNLAAILRQIGDYDNMDGIVDVDKQNQEIYYNLQTDSGEKIKRLSVDELDWNPKRGNFNGTFTSDDASLINGHLINTFQNDKRTVLYCRNCNFEKRIDKNVAENPLRYYMGSLLQSESCDNGKELVPKCSDV